MYVRQKINLVQSIRLGKAQVRQAAAKGEINLERSFIVSSSPHIRDNISTRRIMLDVIIALIPASLAGVYFFRSQNAAGNFSKPFWPACCQNISQVS